MVMEVAVLFEHLPQFSLVAVLDVIAIAVAIPWILSIKKSSTAALAWILVVLLLPLLGFFLFVFFGYNQVYRKLRKKKRHRLRYRAARPAGDRPASKAAAPGLPELGHLVQKLG